MSSLWWYYSMRGSCRSRRPEGSMGVVARWLHDDFLEALHAGLMWVQVDLGVRCWVLERRRRWVVAFM